ncbi:MAG: hypothetical protein AAFO04_30075, partial [Cyanobacteria bacterium J06592_8]
SQIEEDRKVTYLGKNHPELDPEDHPNFKVFEFSPNRLLDQSNRYYLAGPEWSVMQQASHVKATHDLIGQRLGYNIKFEQFWTYWEQGFKGYSRRSKVASLTTNYPENDITEDGSVVTPGWRKDKSTRPAYVEWEPVKTEGLKNVRVIEYWPDRSNKTMSKLFIGSDWTIIRDIIQYDYEGGMGVVEIGEDDGEVRALPEREGRVNQPYLKLIFTQNASEVPKGFRPLRARLTIFLHGLTDNPQRTSARHKLITKTDINRFFNKIKAEFVSSNNPYSYRKGKKYVSYYNSEQGYKFQTNFSSKTQAIELYKKMVSVQGDILDLRSVFVSTNEVENQTYPDNPETVLVLGQPEKLITKRRSGTMYFSKATLTFPSLGKTHVLIHNYQGYWIKGKSLETIT